METTHWPRVKALFEEAAELPPAERRAYLDAHCAGEAALRGEVESLLTADDTAGDFLGAPAVLDGTVQPRAAAGLRIGPYVVEREIGRGGMGTVYLAARADGLFQRKVALKLLRRGLDTDDLLTRFHYERQILASLEHPHIARLYDAGQADDGRPFFAMEHVEGLPITAYGDTHQLTVRQRLALFLTVCEAVQHAHQNLVVHRDLKPSNILVTEGGGPGGGQVKLLDFGIAKLLGGGEPEGPHTLTGLRLMTPAYAAPEQVRGEPVTTATDVYGLGVVLYELLTGRPPYRLGERPRHEVEQAILHEEPARPSAAAGEAAPSPELARRLRGDLDTIVLKALRKEPARRYASVEALADDLRRHLAGLPVRARPDTVGYRAARFIQRHQLGVAAAALVLLAVVGGAVAVLWQARRAAAERDRAVLEAAKAAQISTFLQQMLGAASPAQQGRDVKVADVLDAAAARAAGELAGQPEVEAAVRRTLGITYQDLGLYGEAEQQLRRALALRRRHLGPAHPETAQSLKDYALVRHWQGDLDTAAVYYEDALARFQDLGGPSLGYAEALNDYGLLRMDQAAYRAADSLFRAAFQMYRALDPDRVELASTLNNQALARHWLGDVDAADALYHQALDRFRRHDPEYIDIAQTLNNLAWVYLDRHDLPAADSLLRASLALRRKKLGEAHPDVALALQNLAVLVHLPRGEHAAADSLLRRALAISRAAVPGNSPYTANALVNLGRLRAAEGRFAEAEAYYREALAMRRALHGDDAHPEVADARQRLADLYEAWGRPARAAAYRAAPTGGTP